MARIDDLIAEIGDERVRRAVVAEVKKLREEKKFGLVFENHLPELSYLHGATIKVGANVVKRGTKGAEVYRVVAVEDETATILRDVEGASETERVAVVELTVVKRYGEAIYPALLPVETVTKNPSKPYHTIINSDNYHALQLLLYCYEGKVDVIYIDPPYNTGARDWKYNNNYVDIADSWRHSKWLAMIRKRLVLAKRLLKSDGVLIVAIDDNEVHHLRMLLGEVMPEYDITSVTIVHNPRGNITKNFARTHEYALYVIPKGLSAITRTQRENTTPRRLRRWGHNSTRIARPTMFYPIYVKGGQVVRVGSVPDDDFHPTSKNVSSPNGEIAVYPIDQNGIERRWNFGLDTVQDELERIIAIESDGEIDLFLTEEETTTKTVWTGSELEAGRNGASLVKSITGVEFPFPKSLYTVEKCIQSVVRERPNALILDFFAGSGTTLHATCLLNYVGGGGVQPSCHPHH